MKDLFIVGWLVFILLTACQTLDGYKIYFQKPAGNIQLSFAVASDMRSNTGKEFYYFRGICEMLADGGAGEFMISPGDIDPPDSTYLTIHRYIGPDYPWYPVVGNHEAETESDMSWLREYNRHGNILPNIVRSGPANGAETTYSLDYGEVHFVVLNEYYDGQNDHASDGDVGDALYNWLVTDLQMNSKPLVFVIGHEPAYPQPDQESGRLRRVNESLDKYPAHRDRFWQLLANYQVLSYLCGHTHNYSVQQFNGVWQIDAGHARGIADGGSRSTFILFYIMENQKVWHYTYRMNFSNYNYELAEFRCLN
jgi:predicted phosphodiesterase